MPATATKTLRDLQVGDETMRVKTSLRRKLPTDTGNEPAEITYFFAKITKITEKRIHAGVTEYDRDTGRPKVNKTGHQAIMVPTPEGLAWKAEQERKSADRRATRDAYDAREDVQLMRRLTNMNESWLTLGTERLRRIVAIVDEK